MAQVARFLSAVVIMLFAVNPALGEDLLLQPCGVPEFALQLRGDTADNVPKPVSIPLGKGVKSLADTALVPLRVYTMGSGDGIFVFLALTDPQMKTSRAGLARAAMAEAYALWRFVNPVGSGGRNETRLVTAYIYHAAGVNAESAVLLAEAAFQPAEDTPAAFAFPGPAWKRVVATDGIGDTLEIRYLQEMQYKLSGWRSKRDRSNVPPTPEQAVAAFREYVETGRTPLKELSGNLSREEAAKILGGPPERAAAYLEMFAVSSADIEPDPQAEATPEQMRGLLTPEQDAELSRELGIQPGTVKLDKMLLKPLP